MRTLFFYILIFGSLYLFRSQILNLVFRGLIEKDRLKPYKDILGLEKAGLVYSTDYSKLEEIILPARRSVFSNLESVIWIYSHKNTQIFLSSNNNYDVRIWYQPKTVLNGIHIVLDSSMNDFVLTNLISKKLPTQKIRLEGNFNDSFQLYCGEDQQIVTLQIISPDIMSYLLDHTLRFDVEIVDDHVAIISRGAAASAEKLEATIAAATKIDDLIRVVTKVTKL